MRGPPRWTGWSRSRSAASPSPPPRPPASGASTGSTSSTRPATSTSPSRSSAACACSTARWRCSTRWAASSRSRRRSGARPTSTASRVSPSSTSAIASAPIPTAACARSASGSRGTPIVIQIPNALEDGFSGVVDLIEMKLVDWEDDTVGAEPVVKAIPDELREAAELARATMIEAIAEADDEAMRALSRGARALARAAARRAPPGDRSPGTRCRCSAAPPSGTRACSRCSTRWSTFCRRRTTSRRWSARIWPGSAPSGAPTDTEPFSALAFKIMNDPFVGSLTYFRVYSGKVSAGVDGLQRRQGEARADRAPPAHARQQA